MIIENNQVHHNTIYGLDPHTGAHDMIFRKNVALNCNNITIENNELYSNSDKNTGAGIMFSRNMVNSIARNNNVHNEAAAGISISASHDNQIYSNTISNSGDGINLKNSSNNKIHDNTFINSTRGIDTSAADASGNLMYNNHLINY